MEHTSGTLWRGEGQLELRASGGRTVPLPSVRWQLRAWPLLTGHLAGELSAPGGQDADSVRARFDLASGTMRLADVRLAIPAEAVSLWPVTALAAPSGQLTLEVDAFAWSAPVASGGGQLNWIEAQVGLPPAGPRASLGRVEVPFRAAGERIQFSIRNRDGSLDLDGHGTWLPGGLPGFRLVLRPNAKTPPGLVQALGRLGPSAPDGSVTLSFAGSALAGPGSR